LGPKVALELSKILSDNQEISHLNLANNQIGDEGVKNLVSIF
jgi:hypothetical protein